MKQAKQSVPVVAAAMLSVLLAVSIPKDSRADDGSAVDGRSTSRLSLGLSGVMFARFPGSVEDAGGALTLAKPFWLGTRYRFFQWVAEGSLLAGLGSSRNVYLGVGPDFGCNLYFGPVFGLEFRFGVFGLAQLGDRSVAGVGMHGSGGYVFRFWEDDRKRIKLQMTMYGGSYFAHDPGNDLGTGAMALGLGIAYETPF